MWEKLASRKIFWHFLQTNIINHIYNTILGRNWFSGSLFAKSESVYDHVSV